MSEQIAHTLTPAVKTPVSAMSNLIILGPIWRDPGVRSHQPVRRSDEALLALGCPFWAIAPRIDSDSLTL